MPFSLLRRKLIARGYWEESTGDGAGTTASTGSTDQIDGADKKAETEGAAEKKESPKMSDSEAQLLKDVMKFKTNNKALNDELATVKAKLDQFSGIDLDEVKSLLDAKKQQEQQELERKGQWDALKEQMRAENEKIVASKGEEIANLSKALKDKDAIIQRLTVEHEFSSSKFITDDTNLSPKKAKIIYGEYFDVEDGKVVPYNKPRGESGRVQLVDASGDPLSFNLAIEKIIDDDPDKTSILKSKMKSGANSTTSNSVVPPVKTQKLTGLQQIAAGLAEREKRK